MGRGSPTGNVGRAASAQRGQRGGGSPGRGPRPTMKGAIPDEHVVAGGGRSLLEGRMAARAQIDGGIVGETPDRGGQQVGVGEIHARGCSQASVEEIRTHAHGEAHDYGGGCGEVQWL